jgi:hypothetical protein
MPVIQFDLTTVTTANTTMGTTHGAFHYYGALFGGIQKGDTTSSSHHWIRLPESAPPIGEMPTTTPGSAYDAWGVFLAIPTSLTGGLDVLTPVGCLGFTRGDKWFCIDAGAPILMLGKTNRIVVAYRGVHEGLEIDI